MNNFKYIIVCFSFFIFSSFFSQTDKKEALIGDFKYLLKAKIYKSRPNYIHEELFSLQVINYRAFFISDKSLKFDSIFQSEFQKANIGGLTSTDFRGKSFPKTKFPYTVIQSNSNIQYFERIGMTLLSYKEPVINNWKLINESKKINSFNCKRAEVYYKGRNWVAWYSTDIPFSYGPYKFSGLPGLIIKITDDSGDYDYEMVQAASSDNVKDMFLSVSKLRYDNAKETTLSNLQEAKKNFTDNLVGSLGSISTSITPKSMENLRNIQKQKQQNLADENPIELN